MNLIFAARRPLHRVISAGVGRSLASLRTQQRLGAHYPWWALPALTRAVFLIWTNGLKSVHSQDVLVSCTQWDVMLPQVLGPNEKPFIFYLSAVRTECHITEYHRTSNTTDPDCQLLIFLLSAQINKKALPRTSVLFVHSGLL